MKNRVIVLLMFVTLALIAAVLLKKTAPADGPLAKVDTEKTDFLGQPIEKDETVVVKSQNQPEAPQKIESVSLDQCVPQLSYNKADSLDSMLQQLSSKVMAQGQILESTEYQLKGKQNEEIVVQHIPAEEPKDQVRVFKLGADGFPDRVKDFPQASAKIQQRLNGALTLGTLEKTIEKYKATSTTRGELTFEKESGKVARISFADGKKQLICEDEGEDQNCSCQTF